MTRVHPFVWAFLAYFVLASILTVIATKFVEVPS